MYATNIIFLRRDHFFASEGGVQAFRWIGDDRANLLVLCAEAQLDFCPPLSLSIACEHVGWAVGFTGRRSCVPLHIRSPGSTASITRWSLQSTYVRAAFVQGVHGRLQSGRCWGVLGSSLGWHSS